MTLGDLHDRLKELTRLEAKVTKLKERIANGFDSADDKVRLSQAETLLAIWRSASIG